MGIPSSRSAFRLSAVQLSAHRRSLTVEASTSKPDAHGGSLLPTPYSLFPTRLSQKLEGYRLVVAED